MCITKTRSSLFRAFKVVMTQALFKIYLTCLFERYVHLQKNCNG